MQQRRTSLFDSSKNNISILEQKLLDSRKEVLELQKKLTESRHHNTENSSSTGEQSQQQPAPSTPPKDNQ